MEAAIFEMSRESPSTASIGLMMNYRADKCTKFYTMGFYGKFKSHQ